MLEVRLLKLKFHESDCVSLTLGFSTILWHEPDGQDISVLGMTLMG